MPTYFDLVKSHRQALIVKMMIVIDNQTMRTSYTFMTNLHVDLGIVNEDMVSARFGSRRKARKLAAAYKASTGRKFRLTGTDNSYGFTRLIYTLRGKPRE